jgi:hypothetical protein
MLPLTRSRNRQRFFGGGWNPFSQPGPTLDLSFAGVVTDLTDPNGYTLNTNFIAPQYQIAAQYVVWETNVGLVDKTFSQIITFTRASTATYFDATGTLQSAAIDVPRLDYDPSTLAARGLLIEEQRTNSIRNNTMVGAVAGTPGTVPTNWALGGISGGLATQVVGTGTENGIAYIDIRIFGTNSSGSSVFPGVFFDTTTGIAGTTSQVWSSSVYLSLVAGTGVNFDLAVHEADSGGVFLRSTTLAGTGGVPTTGALNTRRRAGSVTLGASTAFVRPLIATTVTNGASVDFTLRIGLPQLELGAFATSVIPTTTTALTRSADVALVNTLSPWFNATEGTIYAELMRPSLIASTAFANAWSISDNTNNERFLAYNTGSVQTIDAAVTDGGVAQATLVASGSITANTTIKTAFAYAVNDFAWVRDAGTVQTDASGTLPTVDRLYIGANSVGTGQWTGWIRRLTAYPRRLSNAELQAITT